METLKWKEKVAVKPYNMKELAGMYEVSEYVFKTWIRPLEMEIGTVRGKCYNVRQVEIIFKDLGTPGQTMEVPMMETSVIVHPSAIEKYVELSWDLSYRNLLHRYHLCEAEINTIKNFIVKYYQSVPTENFPLEAKSFYDVYAASIDKLSIKRHYEKDRILWAIEFALSPLARTNNRSQPDQFGSEYQTNASIEA
jgi:hypothetical protein